MIRSLGFLYHPPTNPPPEDLVGVGAEQRDPRAAPTITTTTAETTTLLQLHLQLRDRGAESTCAGCAEGSVADGAGVPFFASFFCVGRNDFAPQ